jgi:hypothetical protein
MEIDFSALASRVAAFSDVLGCIILSTDGLVLGSFPPSDEDGPKPAWLKFAALGEPERGFVKFADREVWAYVQSGPYAAFAVATGATRPGVLLDHMEQVLLVATESRDQRSMARAPGRVELVSGARPKAVAAVQEKESADAGGDPSAESGTPGDAEGGPTAEGEEEGAPRGDDSEVDAVILAREFAGLLQEDQPDDEDKS